MSFCVGNKVHECHSACSSSRPPLALWVIGNPASGGGKGHRIINELVTQFSSKLKPEQLRSLSTTEFLSQSSLGERDVEGRNESTPLHIRSYSAEAGQSCKSAKVRYDPSGVISGIPNTAYSSAVRNDVLDFAPSGRSSLDKMKTDSHVELAMNLTVIRTERACDGARTARRMSYETVQARLQHATSACKHRLSDSMCRCSYSSSSSTTSSPLMSCAELPHSCEVCAPSTDAFCVIIVVGGDGTLGEVIHGFSEGTLAAYRNWESAQHAHSQRPCASEQVHTLQTRGQLEQGMLRGAVSSHCDRALLCAFLPRVIYLPAGTGIDFARLTLCCPSSKECVEMIASLYRALSHSGDNDNETKQERCVGNANCVCDAHATEYLSRMSRSSSSSNSSASGCCSGRDKDTSSVHLPESSRGTTKLMQSGAPRPRDTEVANVSQHRVDIGRVHFLCTGQTRYFINECSLGLSCNVVHRANALRQHRLCALLGGTLIFALASILELLFMCPRKIRVAAVPHRSGGCACYSSAASLMGVNGSHTNESEGSDTATHVHASSASTTTGTTTATEVESVYGEQDQHKRDDAMNVNKHSGATSFGDGCSSSSSNGNRNTTTIHDGGASRRTEDARQVIDVVDDDVRRAIRLAGEPCLTPHTRAQAQRLLDIATHEMATSSAASLASRMDESALRELGTKQKQRRRRQVYEVNEREEDYCGTEKGQGTGGQAANATPWVCLNTSTLAFANGRWYGGGLHVAPHANPSDGLLSVTSWNITALCFLARCVSLYTGAHVHWNATTTFDGTRFVLYDQPSKNGHLTGFADALNDTQHIYHNNCSKNAHPCSPHLEQQSCLLQHKSSDNSNSSRCCRCANSCDAVNGNGYSNNVGDTTGNSLRNYSALAQQSVHVDTKITRTMLHACDSPTWLEADGEVIGQLPAVVDLVASIVFVVPAGHARHSQWAGLPAPGTMRARACEGCVCAGYSNLRCNACIRKNDGVSCGNATTISVSTGATDEEEELLCRCAQRVPTTDTHVERISGGVRAHFSSLRRRLGQGVSHMVHGKWNLLSNRTNKKLYT